jgi:flagellar biosynthesis protein FlhA
MGPMAVSLGVLVMVSILIIRIPPVLLDAFFALSLAASLTILLLTIFIRSALDFSSFPTVLLVITTYRLALNVASTRLILSQGHSGTAAAGRVIEAFGHFVMGDNVVIGLIVFSVLLIINFIVITKGSGRIAEVGARFTLDALPGKQMAIDADLSAGLINETGARERRRKLEEESSFFGAMDGASKFVKGDAIAGVIIILINIIGGLIIGVLQNGLAPGAAVHTYTILTVGDGLVAQIPGLIVATAAGLIITKSGLSETADAVLSRQFGAHPDTLIVAACIIAVIGLIPGMPTLLFLALAAAMMGLSVVLLQRKAATATTGLQAAPGAGMAALPAPSSASTEPDIADDLRVDDIRLELGYAVLGMIRADESATFVSAIKNLRRKMAREMGVIIPSVRVQDNIRVADDEYAIFIKEQRVATNRLVPDQLLLLNPGQVKLPFPGTSAIDPAFGLPATWIDRSYEVAARNAGFTTVDATTVLITHLGEVLRKHLPYLMSFAATQKLLDGIGEEHQKLVQAVIPSLLTVSSLQAVLRGLLRDGVSVRNLPEIIEAAAEFSPRSKDISELLEHVRHRLRRAICLQFADAHDGKLNVYFYIPRASAGPEGGRVSPPTSEELARLFETLSAREKVRPAGPRCVLVVPDVLRPQIAEIMRRQKRGLPVMAQGELDEFVDVVIVDKI